jgi:formylmethanofuran dehydrogenase subunit E
MSADTIDNASEAEELMTRAAISMVVAKNKPIEPSAECLQCGEPIEQNDVVPRRWCDRTCRDDWERSKK